MAKRYSRRLGIGGEMVPPGPNVAAQRLFLEAVRRDVPEAMRELGVIAPTLPGGDPLSSEKREQLAPLRAWCEKRGFTATREYNGDPDCLLTVAWRTAAWRGLLANLLGDKAPDWPEAWGLLSFYWGPVGHELAPLRWSAVAP